MGFASGLKNWNSISSNIIQAHQGAESLSLRNEELKLKRKELKLEKKRLKPIIAQHRAKKKAGAYDDEELRNMEMRRLSGEEKSQRIEQNKATFKRAQETQKRVDEINTELLEIGRQQQSQTGMTEEEAVGLHHRQINLKKELSMLGMGAKPGQPGHPGTREAKRAQESMNNVEAQSEYRLKIEEWERKKKAQSEERVWQGKFDASLENNTPFRESYQRNSKRLSEATDRLSAMPSDAPPEARRQLEEQIETLQMEKADAMTRFRVFDAVRESGLPIEEVLADYDNLVVMDEGRVYRDDSGRVVTDKDGNLIRATSMNRERTLANVNARINRIKARLAVPETDTGATRTKGADIRQTTTTGKAGTDPLGLSTGDTDQTSVTREQQGDTEEARRVRLATLAKASAENIDKFWDFLDTEKARDASITSRKSAQLMQQALLGQAMRGEVPVPDIKLEEEPRVQTLEDRGHGPEGEIEIPENVKKFFGRDAGPFLRDVSELRDSNGTPMKDIRGNIGGKPAPFPAQVLTVAKQLKMKPGENTSSKQFLGKLRQKGRDVISDKNWRGDFTGIHRDMIDGLNLLVNQQASGHRAPGYDDSFGGDKIQPSVYGMMEYMGDSKNGFMDASGKWKPASQWPKEFDVPLDQKGGKTRVTGKSFSVRQAQQVKRAYSEWKAWDDFLDKLEPFVK